MSKSYVSGFAFNTLNITNAFVYYFYAVRTKHFNLQVCLSFIAKYWLKVSVVFS